LQIEPCDLRDTAEIKTADAHRTTPSLNLSDQRAYSLHYTRRMTVLILAKDGGEATIPGSRMVVTRDATGFASVTDSTAIARRSGGGISIFAEATRPPGASKLAFAGVSSHGSDFE